MKRFLFILALFLAAACGKPSATVSGCVENGANAKITLIRQGAVSQILLDTLRADARGCFRYKIKQAGKQFTPVFVSVSIDSSARASLLVKGNEHIIIGAKKGDYNYTVEGSEESALLQSLNGRLLESSHRFDSLMALVNAEQARMGNAIIPDRWNRELGDVYVKQYRQAVQFIVKNIHSLACVAALNQSLPNGLPVFSRNEDAVYFRMAYDSLKVNYPSSEYVTALRDEYEYRFRQMDLLAKMETASEAGFIDMKLPDVSAQPVALSSLKGKVILLYFWVSTDKTQLMFNNELKGLYETYHPKGLEIYQVAFDTDKTLWAKAIADQALPWINVCDGLGAASPVLRTYNVTKFPSAFLINKAGDIIAANLSNREIEKAIITAIK
ncbi:MAG: TlpA family protein disulfide reductase [Prevotellaceae bacterium]|jgi:peroxiredoxin|nr:TlpA family protein disulfide reductase [Prevotellaceae bacterium]